MTLHIALGAFAIYAASAAGFVYLFHL
jgi:hypothetical protein